MDYKQESERLLDTADNSTSAMSSHDGLTLVKAVIGVGYAILGVLDEIQKMGENERLALFRDEGLDMRPTQDSVNKEGMD